MGDAVELKSMKKYVFERLSLHDTKAKANGTTSNGAHSNGNVSNGAPAQKSPVGEAPTTQGGHHQNGFIANQDYGDWDSSVSASSTPNPDVPARQPQSSTRYRPAMTKFIPEHEIDIPKDGSLHEYTVDDMSTFLRYLGVEERIVTHVHKKGLDGLKFSKMKDTDLEALGMKNPIMCYFRDRSLKDRGSKKKKAPFML